MTTIALARHAETRMRHRGIRRSDVSLILECGTEIDDETWLMRNRDVKREIERRRKDIQTLGRLNNRKVVMRGQYVTTVYSSQSEDRKRTLRRGRRKGMVT